MLQTKSPATGVWGMSGYQWTVVFAAWLGWGFDVFDGLLFNFVAPNCIPTLLGIQIGSPEAAAPTLWWCMHASGVHSTIAGVLLGWTIPLRADRGGAPLTTLEHALKPWVTWGVMPLFALANAGVVLSGGIDLAHPVALGVGLGLLLGKPLGILGLSYLLVRLGWAKLPRGATWTPSISKRPEVIGRRLGVASVASTV